MHPERGLLAAVGSLGRVHLGPRDLRLPVGLHGQRHALVDREMVVPHLLPRDVLVDRQGRNREPARQGSRARRGHDRAVRQSPDNLHALPPAPRGGENEP